MDIISSGDFNLINLPVVVLEKIFSYLTYDDIAKNRLVSQTFNEMGMRLLNRGFVLIERRHALALKAVKAQLPRRESERRYHPLARHSDILTSLETRISMLNMTYTKFIDNGICCFIPGKVIDEMRRVLSIVETTKTPPRAHEVLQELRDISSMAIEHFDDKISPAFRKMLQESVPQPVAKPSHSVLGPLVLRNEIIALRKRSVLNAKLSLYLAAHYNKVFKKMEEYKKVAVRQRKVIRYLTRKSRDHEGAIAELKKRIEECDIKYSELTHTNQAVGGKAIAGTSADVASTSAQPLRHFGSQIKLDLSVLPIGTSKRSQAKMLPNIKPRKPLIKLPSLSEEDSEPPPKKSKMDDNPDPPTSINKKNQCTMAKIRGITKEIRNLSNLNIETKLKRPVSLTALDLFEIECKKQKLD
ncbi:F-box only protein 28 isoform X2 [Ostrinia furnacalis]|uniref:F-box only protein 28 isoform X1 n=1 Tax=Ostrinia furnacalis TaxID=93504 RepID=UPI00103E082A|nr:F-box only protein 28 isoform X1 [Ostrinia furnacalis]XP_028166839.1 F-box only protein 28 isoform X2 [Ostrinia furnacalis]